MFVLLAKENETIVVNAEFTTIENLNELSKSGYVVVRYFKG